MDEQSGIGVTEPYFPFGKTNEHDKNRDTIENAITICK